MTDAGRRRQGDRGTTDMRVEGAAGTRDLRLAGGVGRTQKEAEEEAEATPSGIGRGKERAIARDTMARDLTPEYRQDEDREPSIEPEKPNFGNSGLLAKETNTVKGVQLKYNEPPEARKPLKNWRLYVFKGKEQVAIQYRQITEKNEFGDSTTTIKPFIIDLDSTNGTHVNDQEIPKSRYYELRNSDVLKFGTSSREYVLLHEEAA
ncbi:smad nuclear-interacting protein 1, partial [Tremellales sp. Uapishka_1]